MRITHQSRQTRRRLWISLWFVSFLWMFAVLGIILGYINLPILGVISIACFISVFWVNNRLVAMGITRPSGICPHCSYDLRGNDSNKCPECGTAI